MQANTEEQEGFVLLGKEKSKDNLGLLKEGVDYPPVLVAMISLSVESTGPCFQNSTAGAPGLNFRWGISLGFDKRSIRGPTSTQRTEIKTTPQGHGPPT